MGQRALCETRERESSFLEPETFDGFYEPATAARPLRRTPSRPFQKECSLRPGLGSSHRRHVHVTATQAPEQHQAAAGWASAAAAAGAGDVRLELRGQVE